MSVETIYSNVPWRRGNRLPMVPESAADEATRQVYQDVKQALGAPVLNLFYCALGAYPEFLQLHWKLFGALARSRDLAQSAERLRADSYTRTHNYLRIADLGSVTKAPSELTSKVDLYHCRCAALLLLFSAQMQALDGPVGSDGQPAPAEPAEFAREETPAGGEKAVSPEVRRTFSEIRRAMHLPYLNPEYTALARWPEFLNFYWGLLKEVMQSPMYRECQYRVRETAWALARELPGRCEMSLEQLTEAGMTQEEIASVGRMLELFVKNLSGLALNMAVGKIALEGGNQQLQPAASKGKPGRAA